MRVETHMRDTPEKDQRSGLARGPEVSTTDQHTGTKATSQEPGPQTAAQAQENVFLQLLMSGLSFFLET